MATILNADTSTGGLIATGDSSGELELQADGTTKISVTSSGAAVTGLNATGMQANGLTYPTSDGTASQVLVTNGSGTLSFADAASGALSLVSEVNASSSDTVELDGMDSTYKTYMIVGSNLVMSSGQDLTFTIKQGGSYLTSGYYGNSSNKFSGSTTLSGHQIENTSSFQFTRNNPQYDSFVMYIFDPAASSQSTQWWIWHTGWSSGTSYQTFLNGAQNTAGATTAIKFDASNQTYNSGNFKLYGLGG